MISVYEADINNETLFLVGEYSSLEEIANDYHIIAVIDNGCAVVVEPFSE
jgi:hypothetical protein